MDKENAYELLDSEGFIEYGMTIPKSKIEQVLEMEFDPKNWEWIGKLLQLKQYIEEQGYFCTQKKCPEGAMRILHLNEMPAKLDNVEQTIRRKQPHAINSMKNADTSDLKEREKAEFYHELHKATLGLKALNRVLYSIN